MSSSGTATIAVNINNHTGNVAYACLPQQKSCNACPTSSCSTQVVPSSPTITSNVAPTGTCSSCNGGTQAIAPQMIPQSTCNISNKNSTVRVMTAGGVIRAIDVPQYRTFTIPQTQTVSAAPATSYIPASTTTTMSTDGNNVANGVQVVSTDTCSVSNKARTIFPATANPVQQMETHPCVDYANGWSTATCQPLTDLSYIGRSGAGGACCGGAGAAAGFGGTDPTYYFPNTFVVNVQNKRNDNPEVSADSIYAVVVNNRQGATFELTIGCTYIFVLRGPICSGAPNYSPPWDDAYYFFTNSSNQFNMVKSKLLAGTSQYLMGAIVRITVPAIWPSIIYLHLADSDGNQIIDEGTIIPTKFIVKACNNQTNATTVFTQYQNPNGSTFIVSGDQINQ
jgi:hypothetical protein